MLIVELKCPRRLAEAALRAVGLPLCDGHGTAHHGC
jgi:hypothetical protein